MKRILHIGKFGHWYVGGIETAIDNLLNSMSSSFKLLHIAAHKNFKYKVHALNNHLELNVPFLGSLASTPLCPTMPFCVRKLHKRYQFSIVHLHFPNPMAHLASEVLPKSVKRIVSWYSDVVQQKRWLILYQPWINQLLKKTDAVVVMTPYLAQHSKQLAIARQRNIIRIVPHGLPFDKFFNYKNNEKILAIKKNFSNRFIVFSLGRHVPYKGFSYLIDAMTQLPANIILLLGGEGPLTSKLKIQVNALSLQNRVFFLGKIKKNDLIAYYQTCDVFCLPSITENEAFGIVQLEAMACSKPVISCDLQQGMGVVNAHGVTGLVVSPRSASALAFAINQFYLHPILLKNIGKSAFNYAMRHFSLENMTTKMLQLYQQVLLHGSQSVL